MRHFAHLSQDTAERLFHRPPQPFGQRDDPATLAIALGATLYAPATRTTLAADIAKQAARGVTSMVIDLEDAVADENVAFGETNGAQQLRQYRATRADGPLLFIRVREPEQIGRMVSLLGSAVDVITGFVMPKFSATNGNAYLHALDSASRASGVRLLGMPVLESPDIIYRETRRDALVGAAAVMARHRDSILAVRIGATDLCSAYGLRRPRDLTIYDLHLVAEVIGDIVNIFGRSDGSGYVVSGPVWEYFSGTERMWKPQLRTTPFEEHHARGFRQELIEDNLDGLIREVVLDQANGLTGKTVIHPTHVAAVHALSVVTHEQFSDATDVLGGDAAGGGVRRSNYANKMNEIKPHRAWATKTLRRATVFGVAAEGVTFVDLLESSIRAAEDSASIPSIAPASPPRVDGQQVPA